MNCDPLRSDRTVVIGSNMRMLLVLLLLFTCMQPGLRCRLDEPFIVDILV